MKADRPKDTRGAQTSHGERAGSTLQLWQAIVLEGRQRSRQGQGKQHVWGRAHGLWSKFGSAGYLKAMPRTHSQRPKQNKNKKTLSVYGKAKNTKPITTVKDIQNDRQMVKKKRGGGGGGGGGERKEYGRRTKGVEEKQKSKCPVRPHPPNRYFIARRQGATPAN